LNTEPLTNTLEKLLNIEVETLDVLLAAVEAVCMIVLYEITKRYRIIMANIK
jgi:hypothetical protein